VEVASRTGDSVADLAWWVHRSALAEGRVCRRLCFGDLVRMIDLKIGPMYRTRRLSRSQFLKY